jgi:hypothetical protein
LFVFFLAFRRQKKSYDWRFLAAEAGKYDLVFDKDAFGALAPAMRPNYVQTIKEYLKIGI